MRRRRNRAASIRCLSPISVAILLTACGTQGLDAVDSFEPDFRPLARYVVETNIFWDFNDYVRSMSDGTFEYDEVVRQPFVPAGPIDIDCDATHRIGATIFLFNFEPSDELVSSMSHSIPIHAKSLRVSYEWAHSGNEKSGGRYRNDVFPDKNGFISTGLILKKEDRVEGLISLHAKYKDETIYSTSFNVTGCAGES